MEELQVQPRNLAGDQDLEMMVEHDEASEEKELKAKIVFAMQGLGGARTVVRNSQTLQAYIKGVHCEDSVKDLIKFIRSDPPANPKTRLILSSFNIVESDLVELLILQVEDKKLSFWLIALLALLTAKVSEQLIQEERQALQRSLRQYKNSFLRNESLMILVVHISEYFKIPPEQRHRAHCQMLQFTVLLIRNLLQISNSADTPQLHSQFLVTFVRDQVINSMQYLIQNEHGPIMEKIDIALLQIFFYVFTFINPQSIYPAQGPTKYIGSGTYRNRLLGLPARHSRFMPSFKRISTYGYKSITHTLKHHEPVAEQQLKQPIRTTEMKRVRKIHPQHLSDHYLILEVQVMESGEHQTRELGELVFEMCRQFVEVQFELLIKLVFDLVFKSAAKVSENNVIQYLLLCSWALQMTQCKYEKEVKDAQSEVDKVNVEFQLANIAEVMKFTHFELIYKLLANEARLEKKHFKINVFHAALNFFKQYLDIIAGNTTSMSPSDRRNANALMGNMFRHDIARVLRQGFLRTNHEEILSLLIIVSHRFFSLLKLYAEGRILTIQTNKLVRRRKKRMEQYDEEEELAHQEERLPEQAEDQGKYKEQGQDDDQGKEEHEGERNQEQELRFQQRKYNEKTQFAILAQYSVIDKYMLFLREQRFASNTVTLNDAIFYFIREVKHLLDGEWLFFQADTLVIFQTILSHPDFRKNAANKDHITLIASICRGFVKLLKRNRLALVQSLFHYTNATLKERVMKNYDNDVEEDQELHDNMFTDLL